MSGLTTVVPQVRPTKKWSVERGICAVLTLLIATIAPEAIADGTLDETYSTNIKFSDVHFQRGHGSEIRVTGRVTNAGPKTVTGLMASVISVGRPGHADSRAFIIVGTDAAAPPLPHQPLKGGESRDFSATVSGLSRLAGAKIEVQPGSLLTKEESAPPPPTPDFLFPVTFIITALIVVAGVVLYRNLPSVRAARQKRAEELAAQAKQQAEALKRQEEAAQKLFEVYTSAPDLPMLNESVLGVILQRDEKCCLLEPNVGHVVINKRTRYVGGSHGVSFRIMKGVYYRVGAYSGHPVTETSEVVGDVGNLYVTNQRVIFAGSSEITSVPVKKVSDVRIAGSDVVILSENRKTPFILRTPTKYGSVVAAAAIRRVTDDALGNAVPR